MAYQDYMNLTVWQKSMDMVVMIYQITKSFPADERYALTDQIKRAVVSIPSNIAEGHGRNTKAEFSHFLFIARGSLQEVITQLEIAYRLEYITKEIYDKTNKELDSLSRMIYSLINSQKSNN